MRNLQLLLLLAVLGLPACKTHKASFSGTEFEKHSSLAQTGFTQAQLDKLTKYLEEHAASTGMVILHEGKLVYEYGNTREVSYIASCRKSVLSMLYGKYVENATIDLQQNIGSLGIDEKDGLLPIEKKATVDHIITSRSGVFHIPANGGYDEKNILARGSVEPGEYFVYNNWDFNVAGHIFEQHAGASIYQEIEDQLAKPLGFQDWNIKNQKKRHNEKKSQYPAYHMYFSTRDMAKIGQLMLNEGNWNGEQLISKAWIQKITSTVTPLDTVNKRNGFDSSSPVQFSYGYMWWLFEYVKGNPDFEGAYSASGYGGQYITVIPKRKVVIAHKTKLDLLSLIGLRYGGMPDYQYWEIVSRLMGNEF